MRDEKERDLQPEQEVSPEAEIIFLEREQKRLLAEMSMADGIFGRAERRRLAQRLRQTERRLAQLRGESWPWWRRFY